MREILCTTEIEVKTRRGEFMLGQDWPLPVWYGGTAIAVIIQERTLSMVKFCTA